MPETIMQRVTEFRRLKPSQVKQVKAIKQQAQRNRSRRNG